MMAGNFFCRTHQTKATEFCVCGTNSVYLCVNCLPSHLDKSFHTVFPIACFGLYKALGNNKAEVQKRLEIVKLCNEFLDKAAVRETAVATETMTLVNDLVQSYKGWLEENHLYFTDLVQDLREEIALLITTPSADLSPLSQVIVERSHALSEEEEKALCFIPEQESLKEITARCSLALAQIRELPRLEYQVEVQQSFLNLPPVPPQGDEPKLIAVLEREVKCFDVETSQWQQLLALREKINVNSYTSSIFIGPSTIFVCGGGEEPCTCQIDKSAYVLTGDGSVQELPPMSTGRNWPGLAWDSERKVLFVFGGSNGGTCYAVYLRTSEMFRANWSALADMHQARSYFNPCWYSSLLYLCGGYNINSVETYDPQVNIFTLQDFVLPETWGTTTAVVECGMLTVISVGYISKLQQGRLICQRHQEYYPWSACTPVVNRRVVYLYYDGVCRCIDLDTGEVQKEVRLR